jgi:hypothetical protein
MIISTEKVGNLAKIYALKYIIIILRLLDESHEKITNVIGFHICN